MKRNKIQLTKRDTHISKKNLLCSNNKCVYNTDHKQPIAYVLCPFCHKKGWCTEICLHLEIIKHVIKECDQLIKTPIWIFEL